MPTTAAPFKIVLPVPTVKLANVPTLVKLEFTTFEASVVPDKVPASAADEIVISPLPSKSTLFIFLTVANFAAVEAVPAVVAVVALPDKLPIKPGAVIELLNVFAPAIVWVPVDINPGFVPSAAVNVKAVPLMFPPVA